MTRSRLGQGQLWVHFSRQHPESSWASEFLNYGIISTIWITEPWISMYKTTGMNKKCTSSATWTIQKLVIDIESSNNSTEKLTIDIKSVVSSLRVCPVFMLMFTMYEYINNPFKGFKEWICTGYFGNIKFTSSYLEGLGFIEISSSAAVWYSVRRCIRNLCISSLIINHWYKFFIDSNGSDLPKY